MASNNNSMTPADGGAARVARHCRCGNPYESIYSQFIARCRECERFEEAYGAPAHYGADAAPNAPAILSSDWVQP